MKKSILSAIVCLTVAATASAQNYTDSRYFNPYTGKLDYSSGPVRESRPEIRSQRSYAHYDRGYGMPRTYVGFRVGPAFTHVTSDDPALDGGSWKTGLNVGLAVGTAISYNAPIYLETGLYYTEKGGKGNGGYSGGKFTYNLDYLEIPLVFKYKAPVSNDFTVEPYFGGYFAVGVGGKIKNYNDRDAYSAFSSNCYDNGTFQRCDGGLKFGVGAAYTINRDAELYMELGYDLGLANICHDTFDKSKNGALVLNFGVNL